MQSQIHMANNVQIYPGLTQNSAPDNSTSTAYEADRMVKNEPGNLYGLSGYSSNTERQFIQIHDAAAPVPNGAVPVIVFPVDPEQDFSVEFTVYGRHFNNGIYVCNSTTPTEKTAGAADCWFDV